MSFDHVLYQENKFFAYFKLAQVNPKLDPLLDNEVYVTLVHHFHYPVVYYEHIYKHFLYHFRPGITDRHLRISIEGQQLRSDLPIGLYTRGGKHQFMVHVSEFPCQDGFAMILNNWKMAFTLINSTDGCDHLKNRLDETDQRQLYQRHCEGKGHRFQQLNKYEGNVIVVRLFVQGRIVERKAAASTTTTIRNFLESEFPEAPIDKYVVEMHGVTADLELNLKELLDNWSYNDGFVYLTIS